MAKSLRVLSRQLRSRHGKLLITDFNDLIRPGSILHAASWNDIDLVGHLESGVEDEPLPEVEGPAPVHFGNFTREHDLQVDGALELLKPSRSAGARFRRARAVKASFESPVATSFDLFELSDFLRHSDSFWQSSLSEALFERRTRIVYQAVRGKLTFGFTTSGETLLDLRGELGSLQTAGLAGRWSWRSDFMLESKKEMLLAVETARWSRRKDRIVPMKSRV